jgi:guanine nucleotide-binding protein subunit beta-2-like 1 protein
VDELKPEFTDVGKNARDPEAISLSWSSDGQTLYAGYVSHITFRPSSWYSQL